MSGRFVAPKPRQYWHYDKLTTGATMQSIERCRDSYYLYKVMVKQSCSTYFQTQWVLALLKPSRFVAVNNDCFFYLCNI